MLGHMNAMDANRGFDASDVRAAVLRVLPGILALYVFGSRARGLARVDSDLDLAVLTERPIEPLQLFKARQTLEAALGQDVDLVDLSVASSVLRSEVVNGGVLVYRRDAGQTLDFEARVLGEYAGLLDATREIRQRILERGSVYTR